MKKDRIWVEIVGIKEGKCPHVGMPVDLAASVCLAKNP